MKQQINFKKGLEVNLPAQKTAGTVYFTEQGNVYYDYDNDIRLKLLGQNSQISTTQVIHSDANALLSTIIENYILNIDYDRTLKFDVTELVIGGGATSPILGVGMLGYMVLA